MLPGILAAALQLPPAGALSDLVVFPARGVVVPAGSSVEHAIDVRLARAEVFVRTPAGEPAVGVPLRLAGSGVRGPDLLPTDGAGVTRAQRIDAGRYTVLTAPRSCGDDTTRIARDAWFAVGTVDVRPGIPNRFEITLPPAWDR